MLRKKCILFRTWTREDIVTSIFEIKKNTIPVMIAVATTMAQTSMSNGLRSEKNLGLTVGRGLANVKKSLSWNIVGCETCRGWCIFNTLRCCRKTNFWKVTWKHGGYGGCDIRGQNCNAIFTYLKPGKVWQKIPNDAYDFNASDICIPPRCHPSQPGPLARLVYHSPSTIWWVHNFVGEVECPAELLHHLNLISPVVLVPGWHIRLSLTSRDKHSKHTLHTCELHCLQLHRALQWHGHIGPMVKRQQAVRGV